MRLLNIGTNQKLGARVGSLSRPVGPTCPKACPFLETECYAERLQDRYRNVETNWAQSYDLTAKDWREWQGRLWAEIERSKGKLAAIRIHVGGDFLKAGGEVDREYCASLCSTLESIASLPPVWAYTHAWRELTTCPTILARLRQSMVLFASVHTAEEAQEAIALGYRLALDPGTSKSAMVSGFHEIYGVRSLQCPEMVKGHERVTCDKCRYCFTEQKHGHVTFGRH